MESLLALALGAPVLFVMHWMYEARSSYHRIVVARARCAAALLALQRAGIANPRCTVVQLLEAGAVDPLSAEFGSAVAVLNAEPEECAHCAHTDADDALLRSSMAAVREWYDAVSRFLWYVKGLLRPAGAAQALLGGLVTSMNRLSAALEREDAATALLAAA